jgi:Zn-finger nucleic acid-binding protein
MKCPVCKEPNLVMADRQGIEVDYCPQCRGVWLDRGELDKIIERSVSPPARGDRGDERGGERGGDRSSERGGEHRGDRDDERRGDWSGERSGDYSGERRYDRESGSDYRDRRRYDDDDHDSKYRKKRGSWLGELFDFD